jgi:hypothetical protein
MLLGMHIQSFIIIYKDVVWEVNCISEQHVMLWYGRCSSCVVYAMKDYVSLDFHHATIVVLVGHPNEVTLCLSCIPQEFAHFTMCLKFGQLIVDNMYSAVRAKGAKV